MKPWLMAAFASTVALSGAAKAVEPAPGVTKAQAGLAFSSAVIMTCLTQQERGGTIRDLPDEYRSDLVVAEGPDQHWPGNDDPKGDVWISRTLGSHLRVATVGTGKCEVIADQLPVDDTLRKTQLAAEHLNPPFSYVPAKPGYNPIVYQDERVKDGKRIVIHTEGSEPGGFNHMSRFSLLYAAVTSH